VIGNVLGDGLISWVYSPSNNNFSGSLSYIFKLGYPNMGNNSYTSMRPPSLDPFAFDTYVGASVFRHGNYDYANNSIIWDPNPSYTRTLPSSLFLPASPPTWLATARGRR